MSNKLLIALSFFVLGFSLQVYTQIDVITPPKEFSEGYISKSIVENYSQSNLNWANVDFNSKGKWKIYCDRNEVRILKNPNVTSIVIEKLPFRTELNVIGYKDNFLKVQYLDNNQDLQLGYVEPEHTFLWQRALCGKNGFPKKVISLTSINRNTTDDGDSDMLYVAPECHQNMECGRFKRLELFFILKESKEHDSYLISASSDLSNGGGMSSIKGWVKKNNVQLWSTRIAYLESRGFEAHNAYQNKQICVFKNVDVNDNVAANINDAFINSNKVVRVEEISEDTKVNLDRPLLFNLTEFDSEDRTNKRDLVVIVNYSEDDAQVESEIRKSINDLKARYSEINLLFVIDGTASMQPNIKGIKDALNDFIKKDINLLGDMDFTASLTVYRDKEDKANEIFPVYKSVSLKSQQDQSDFLSKIEGINCFSNPKDYSFNEQLYLGMKKGVENSGFKQNSANILILIGDAGNDDDKPSNVVREDIDALIKKYGCDLFILQSTNLMHEAFEGFSDDAIHWINEINTGSSNSIHSETENKNLIISTKDENHFQNPSATFITQINNEGDVVPASMITSLLYDELNYIRKKYNKRLVDLQEKINGNKSWDEETVRILAQNSGKSFEEYMEVLNSEGHVSVVGQTNMKYYGKDVSAYTPYVFVTSKELDIVIEKFNKLKGMNQLQAAQALEDFFTDQLKIMHGLINLPNNDPKIQELKSQTVEHAWNELFNVDFVYPELSKVKIGNLSSGSLKNKTVKKELNHFLKTVQSFKLSQKEQRDITWTNNYNSSNNSEEFLWIPARKFPGMKSYN
ncbi:MAG: hypothetical protein CL823_05680 [Crocinitomicaceae bacterium]|nr:hypothetical protein [Crocinitomicaceae bacterium]